MAAVLATTTNSIRAAIGVTINEVTDDQIIDLNVEDQLMIYLARVYPEYGTIAAAVAPDASPVATDEQKALWRAVKLLCQYAGAVIVLQSAQYLLFQVVTSAGVTSERAAKDDLETTLNRLEAMRDLYLDQLNVADDQLVNTYIISPILAVRPRYDPVIGS